MTKLQEAKWLSEEALQIAEERQSKRQGRKGKINTTECGVPEKSGRDKKTMQRHRGNNRMGKTRDCFKKTGEIKGTFHAKMGSIKDRNGLNLTEAEEVMK